MFGLAQSFIAALILSMALPNAARATMIEDCARAVNDYAWYLDHAQPDLAKSASKFAKLFTGDGALTVHDDDLNDQTHTGHKAIANYYLDNRSYTRYLHVTSNIRINPTSDTTATGTSYASFYIHSNTGSMKDEGALTGVMEFRDEYRISEGACRFSKRRGILRLLSIDGVIGAPVP